MLIKSIEFVELELPFKSKFSHARKYRSRTVTVLVRIFTSTGVEGWGEIVPRSYVTGETVDSLFDPELLGSTATGLAQQLVGRLFVDQYALINWIDEQLSGCRFQTAMFGGFELALWNALCQTDEVDFDSVLGPFNARTLGKCRTIGLDTETGSLREQAIAARMTGATVVKLKIGAPDDSERLHRLNDCLKGKLPIRVDANGLYSADQAESLLKACAHTTSLQSIEEPFARNDADMLKVQRSLYKDFGVAFVADESVCSLDDAQEAISQGFFQVINLRVGKLGGLWASRKIRDLASEHGMGLVCGSMVGETGILTQASELLLSRSTQFDYVEGLGQNSRLLAIDPVNRMEVAASMDKFTFKDAECRQLIKRRLVFN